MPAERVPMDEVEGARTFAVPGAGFLAGVGPAGSYSVSLNDDERDRLREAVFARFGSPAGPFTLGAVARCAVGRVPG